MEAILTRKLTKIYSEKVVALNDFSFTVSEGSVYGLLGGKGAGKTTLVKLLSGLEKPTSGECTILNWNPMKTPEQIHQSCGVLTQTAGLYKQMTGWENLLFFGGVSGLKRAECGERAAELMRELDILPLRDQKVWRYTTSEAQRLSLARALMHRPRVLLLDEPVSGLDSDTASAVLNLIFGIVQNEGMTVLLCTRFPQEAEVLCEKFGVLSHGCLIADGDLNTLSEKAGCWPKAVLRIPEEDHLQDWTLQEDGFWGKKIQNESEMPEILREMVAKGHDIYEARVIKPTLTNIYKAFLGGMTECTKGGQ